MQGTSSISESVRVECHIISVLQTQDRKPEDKGETETEKVLRDGQLCKSFRHGDSVIHCILFQKETGFSEQVKIYLRVLAPGVEGQGSRDKRAENSLIQIRFRFRSAVNFAIFIDSISITFFLISSLIALRAKYLT